MLENVISNLKNNLGGQVSTSYSDLSEMLKNLSFSNRPFAILDILIVAILIYWFFVVIRETRAIKILYGIMILIAVYFASSIFGLLTLNWLIRQFILMLIVAIPIVFQPELRRALERLGQTKIFGQFAMRDRAATDAAAIAQAIAIMSEKKTGSLIVIKRKSMLSEIIASGTKIEGQISNELILNLFFPKSPLHDGAVIIADGKIIAAGCTLPVSESRIGSFGLRHRAALGLSEQTDAMILVTSEEKGTISFVRNGTITQNVTQERLEKLLINLFRIQAGSSNFSKKEV